MSAMGKCSSPVVARTTSITTTTEAGGDVTFMGVQEAGLLGTGSLGIKPSGHGATMAFLRA
jgi:hypothetical protein